MNRSLLHPAFKDSRLKQLHRYPQLHPYYDVTRDFVIFLHDTERINIEIKGLLEKDDDIDSIRINRPYLHRWTKPYANGRIAKGYALENYMKDNPSPVTLLTLTGYHDYNKFGKKVNSGKTLVTCYDSIKYGYNCLRMMIRKDHPTAQWFWAWEPHETGYPHMHLAYLGEFTDAEMERYREHWSKKLRIGDREHGLNFEVSKTAPIDSMRNYLIGYTSKTLAINAADWTPAELVFNAITWKNRYRTFGATRTLSKVMAMPTPEYSHNFYWVATSILGELPGYHIEKELRHTKNDSLLTAYENNAPVFW